MGLRSRLATRLLDLRFSIAVLFLIFGVLVTGAGLASDAESVARSGGININLWTGGAMLLLSAVFIAWLYRAPVELPKSREEIVAEHLDQEWGEQESGS